MRVAGWTKWERITSDEPRIFERSEGVTAPIQLDIRPWVRESRHRRLGSRVRGTLDVRTTGIFLLDRRFR